MEEPERIGDLVDDYVREPDTVPTEQFADEPKAYAFDGWSMVPLETA